MQIKVEANDMYTVLTGHGIDATEAKAIILDLLLSAEGTVLGETVGAVAEPAPATHEDYEDDSSLDDAVDAAPYKQNAVDTNNSTVGKVKTDVSEKTQTKSKITRKRLNFGAFGGSADGLT